MAQANAITREEFEAAHKAVQADIARLDKQMNGNGQPGVMQFLGNINAYVEHQKGKEQAENDAKQDSLNLAALNERKSARSRALVRWVAGGVGLCLLGIFGWTWSVVEPPVAAIIEEYYQHHPGAVHHGYFDAPPQPGVSVSQPQTTTNTPHL